MIDQESIEEHLRELAAVDIRIKKLWGLVGLPILLSANMVVLP